MANPPDDDVRRIAHLARLALTDEEVERFREDLRGILDLVTHLDAVDLDGVEPTFGAGGPCPLREDRPVDPEVNGAQLVEAAPRTLDGAVAVPRVLETER